MNVASILDFLIIVFFASNFWILVYNTALQLLNISFPVSVPIEFIRSGAVPEPFEIPLYLLITCMAIGVLFKIRTKSIKTDKLEMFIKCGSLLFLIALFFQNIGVFPMNHSVYPYQIQESTLTYVSFFLSYSVVCCLFILLSFVFNKQIEKKRGAFFILTAFLVGVIALFTFEPGFPIVGHDYSFFLGPMWEVAHGKTLYSQVPSQYGFLSVLFLTLIYKIGIFSPYYISAFVWMLYIIEYFLCFYLFYKTSNFLPLALTGLLSLLTLNYFSIYHLPASIAQTGPLRWLPLIVALYVFYKSKNITSKWLLATVSIGSLWVLDSGISLLLAYGFTLTILWATKEISMKKVLHAIAQLVFIIGTFFVLINVVHIILGFKPIIFMSIFAKIREYGAAGFGMIPIDSKTYFWIVVLAYIATIAYFFQKKKCDLYDQIVLFAANISFFAGVYFVGRSHPHNLFHTSIFPITNIFILFAVFFRQVQSYRQKIAVVIGLLFFFIIVPIYNRHEVMTLMIGQKINALNSGNPFVSSWQTALQKKYAVELPMIQRYLPDSEAVILSSDDTYLFYLIDKKNMMNDNSQITILTKKGMDESLSNVAKACPQIIVTDCSLYKKCNPDPFSVAASFSIQPMLLQRIQELCHVTYQPVECTDQLCIVSSQKK